MCIYLINMRRFIKTWNALHYLRAEKSSTADTIYSNVKADHGGIYYEVKAILNRFSLQKSVKLKLLQTILLS